MSTYLSKNPSLSRSGRYVNFNFSAPRTICYTQSQSARTFSFQVPKSMNTELTGNLNKKVSVPEAKEEVM